MAESIFSLPRFARGNEGLDVLVIEIGIATYSNARVLQGWSARRESGRGLIEPMPPMGWLGPHAQVGSSPTIGSLESDRGEVIVEGMGQRKRGGRAGHEREDS